MKRKKIALISLACVSCLSIVMGGVALSTLYKPEEKDDSSTLLIRNNNIKSEKISEIEYKLVATVYPEYNFNKSVNWSMEFTDPTSEWAKGKKVGDYIELKVDKEDQTICTIHFKLAFGEQITITCSSLNYPDIKASCTIDYIKKITATAFYINEGLLGENNYIAENSPVQSSYNVIYSTTYSLDREYSNLKMDVDIYPQNGAPGVNTIPYDETGKTINYSCIVRYLTKLLKGSSTFSTTVLMDDIKNDAEADIFLSNEYIEEKELYVAALKKQKFTFRGRLYEGDKLLFTSYQNLSLKLKDVTSILLSESNIIF